jgi:NCS1 family nucleobase:cation symporter-1
MSDQTVAGGGIAETRSIEQIPLDERTGRARSLFGIWFGFMMVPLACVVGAIGVTLGLPLFWAIFAAILGNFVGGLTMGLHATQGPRLGVPQMLQARGQFGLRGASIPAAAVVVVAIGFFSFNIVVGNQAIQLVFDLPTFWATTISAVVSLVICLVGYRLIQITSAIVALVIGVVVLFLIVLLIAGYGPQGASTLEIGFTAPAFFTTLAVAASWQVGLAPFVSDYSRYMPPREGERRAFIGTYFGACSGGALMMTLGAYLAAHTSAADPLAALAQGFGGLGKAVLVAFFVAVALANTVNSYTGSLAALTCYETFTPGAKISLLWRNVTLVLVHVVGLVIALAASASFVTNFLNFVTVLLYLLIPWSAINLADYFIVRHGDYDVASFFAPDGGQYGLWNARAIISYLTGVIAQVPFLVTPIFTGFLVHHLHGVDIAWIVGFVVPGAVFLALNRRAARVRGLPSTAAQPARASKVAGSTTSE